MTFDDSKLRKAVERVAQAPVPADVHASLFEAGVVDSFGLVELVAELEAAFGISVADEEMLPSRFETLARIAELVRSKVG